MTFHENICKRHVQLLLLRDIDFHSDVDCESYRNQRLSPILKVDPRFAWESLTLNAWIMSERRLERRHGVEYRVYQENTISK